MLLILFVGNIGTWGQTEISSLSDINDPNGSYTLSSDFSTTGDRASTEDGEIGSAGNPFKGTIDGQLVIITGTWNKPLFDYVEDATIKNVIIGSVSISASGNAGAIAANAQGETRIYNCGILDGTVSGGAYTGGLVGLLNHKEEANKGSRVVNCYSYANITGGSVVGGIVGYNNFKSSAGNIKTMVMNCMFYGDITGGTTVSPVYGGNIINNLNNGKTDGSSGLNTFNYYAYDKLKTKAITDYNCALAVEEKYLNRFEFYRLLLNSNKKLAAIYASTATTTVNPSDMAKWVLETADRSISGREPYPYPILKAQGKYPSIINYDVENAPDSATVGRSHGGKLGSKTLSVIINNTKTNGGQTWPTGARVTTTSLTLIRTDKDFDRFNYNYDKVQLPYYNDVGEGNYTGNRVVTGWKITAMETPAGYVDPYTKNNYDNTKTYASTATYFDYPNYNFADRKSVNKDLYAITGRIFPQGAYFDVPYGVTSITIEPYWGKAIYLSDPNYDVVYKIDYTGLQNVTQTGTQVVTSGTRTDFHGQRIETDVESARNYIHNNLGGFGSTVYDNAIVLVGNNHRGSVPNATADRPYTLMSVDEDNDHEPDYSFIYHHTGKKGIAPIRFDFLNVIGTAQAQKPNGASNICNTAILHPKGWFEITNTSLMYFSQLEYQDNVDNGSMSEHSPLILQGGVIEQLVSANKSPHNGRTIYVHVGGNVWFKEFNIGIHGDGSNATAHVPVSVTGGDYNSFYLTGIYNPNATAKEDNAECYISGGHFGEAAGAGQEQIKGSVHWQIYNADIDNFFGGGINDNKPITGTVTTDIYNSHVGIFCGGPKFGNMQSGKDVTTNAVGCEFDTFFGAGYGGSSYSRVKFYDKDNNSVNWSSWDDDYVNDRGKYYDGTKTNAPYGKKGKGVATDFDYEFFVWSSGLTGGRFYVKYATFSLAQCNDVNSTLTGCTVNQSFYGGGNLGSVTGTATSVLDGCTVHGNVFGGGYSATLPTIEVRDAGFTTNPNYNKNSGMLEPGVFSGMTEYQWKHVDNLSNGGSGTTSVIQNGKTINYVLTDADLTALGQVGETDLVIKGNTTVAGGVFGGGDESAISAEDGATGNTKVTIEKNDNNESPTITNVYGGGNTADVDGDTEVVMTSGTVSNDIFGGGKGKNTVVAGDVKVNIGDKNESTGALSGTGIIRNVYGGSAFGAVNTSATKDSDGNVTVYTPSTGKTTKVNIYGCTSIESIFGGGLGEKTESSNIAAQNFGNTTVNMEGGTVKAVYGGSNANGVLKQNSTVTIIGGTVGTSTNPISNAVFGGGFGEPTLVEGDVEVNIGTKSDDETPVYTGNATINGHVYGGGALGSVNASKPEGTLVFDAEKKVDVNLYQGTINGDAYGGGLGNAGTAAYVGGNVNVILDGAKITGSIFGCNNLNGTPKGHVKVHVKRTVNINDEKNALKNNSGTPFKERTTYDVEAVYGGGNKADYVPTDATITLPATDAEDYEEQLAKFNAACAEVIIDGCDATSIRYVYGGGNAAAVPASDVTINGSYIIDQVFGGGNGAGEGNPGANVGIYKLNNAETNYGTGVASTKLVGGKIHVVYGGSNTKGNVRGGTEMVRKEANTCTLQMGEIYGAGQVAPMDGDVNIILECMPEDFVDKVFGGAKNATINGNVTLTVTSGKFGRVFGGNNEGGSINGSITVNAYEDGCLPLIIGELYGGGYNAPYSIWGCNDDDKNNVWEPNTPSGTPHVAADADAIQVNVFSCTSIGKVFGGGYGSGAKVVGNTHVWINTMKGFIDDPDNPGERKENVLGKIGQVFGGGNNGLVKGNTIIDIGTATVKKYNKDEYAEDIGVNITSGADYLHPDNGTLNNSITAGIYGGGDTADVDGNATLNIGTADQNLGIIIGGDIYGGGYGESTHVTGNVTVNIGKKESDNTTIGYATITGDVYGGSAKGTVNSTNNSSVNTYEEGKNCYTEVNLYGGSIIGNVYGGGFGDTQHAADVWGNVVVNVDGIAMKVEKNSSNEFIKGRIFGGNNVQGSPKGTTTVNVKNTTAYPYIENETSYDYHIANVFGGGNQAAFNGTSTSVQMSGGNVYDVFGGGLGSTAIVNGNTSVEILGGSVTNDIYGGGSLANVTGAVTLALNGGTVGRDVYGGGALAQTNAEYDANDNTKKNYITTVNLGNSTAGTIIGGNLYGGGLGRKAGGNNAAVAANVNGPVSVTVTKGLATNVFGCNNLYGAPQRTVTVNIEGTNAPTANIPLPIRNVYGGGNQADYTYTDATNPQNLQVNIKGGTIGNVFGGGLSADVAGGINVKVSGGIVVDDVYGGGALANTNTGNWSVVGSALEYVVVTGLTVGTTSVAGYYTRSGSEGSYVYTLVTSGNAAAGTTYYQKKVAGTWATGLNGENGTTYKTNVSLTGGLIGNAYGGGLGQIAKGNDPNAEGYKPAIAAMVYGDVKITVNDPNVIGTDPGVAFTQNTTKIMYGEGDKRKEYVIPLTGRVFGCNNQNGTPTGNVRVEVHSTRQIDANNNIISGHGSSNRKYPNEMQAVYGGGNLSDYLPANGKGTSVYIDGCNETSIEKVYGGGNSASVPASDVTINACYDIGYAFGGGNGGDLIYKNDEWIENEGAIVIGLAKITPKGGKMGQVFGGSDAKGVCGSTTVDLSVQNTNCPLVLTRIYGAGNEADVADDVNMIISGCTSDAQTIGDQQVATQIEYVYGGSYNAHITGNVTLTITSGIFKYVYGGNDRTGSIGGNITVNIEERDECNPIIIEHLLGGGNEAPYPGTKRDGTEITTRGTITVNVKSATYIGDIFGGSYKADVNGDTEVNINMTKGFWAGKNAPTGYTDLPNVHNGTIDDAIGTIGAVYGGGNQGRVRGNSTVNIGTSTTVPIIDQVTKDGKGKITNITYNDATVLGAHITGDVFGGGNLADVNGNTEVNICAKKNGSVYEAVAEGTDKVTIGGNIYGGGNGADDTFTCEKGMVGVDGDNTGAQGEEDRGTHIHIGNGTVGTLVNGALKEGTGNIYGGGKVGRVEFHSVVEVGLTPQTNSVTSAPEILGNVFGGGKGVETHGYAALLRGHTSVTVKENAKVRNSVYGGGEISTIGRFWIKNVNNKDKDGNLLTEAPSDDLPDGMPYKLKDGGKCTVSILDNAEIGPTTIMAMPQFTGNVFGAGKGFLPKVYDYSADDDYHRPKRVSPVGDDYFKDEAAYMVFIETQALVDETYVTIDDNAFVKGSVYGGSENGRVLNDTHVNIDGGQIGWGKNATGRHADGVWETNYVPSASTDLECPSWNYELPFAPYDKFAQTNRKYDYTGEYSAIKEVDRRENTDGGMPTGSDGHTFYGNVFGGGSGKDPFAPGKWHRQAGFVGGDTHVTITGGHILSNVYGGNEHTDVGTYGTDGLTYVSGGKCTIQMSGGTIGVPRTPEKIAAHPESGYLFGAGKGDQRIFFNTWTNVQNTDVSITGGTVFGSVLGGGEDGHVLTDTKVEIKGGTIGTTGTSSFDGNVFGGGRGLSGSALTAGSVGGNVDLDITGGTIKGNVYGGGRLASVGIDFTPADDPSYGQLVDDKPAESKTYGHISIDISGGTIGTTTASDDTHPVGGNVYGGSMGRITLLDGSLNPLWPKQAVVKLTNVTISGGEIKNNVYGGSEYGIVRNQATVTMTNGNVYGNVFGGGYGSDRQDQTTITAGGYTSENPTLYYTFTPMLWTGCVSGNTFVNISGGTVAKNVYGGGDMASVGLINFNSSKDEDTYIFNYITKHDDPTNGFALSWPYKFEYIKAAPNDPENIGGNAINGKATISITGGTIGTKTNGNYADNTGFVFGGSKGKVWFGATKETVQDITTQRYTEAFMANVLKTEVTIGGGTMRTVYGGGEDGHVYEDAKVTVNDGTIENSVFGGGKGEGIFKTTLWQQDTNNPNDLTAHVDLTDQNVHSWTAGKVYGNTEVIMNGGSVGMFIYGGGNLGSVGKGNYAGGSDDYSTAGYGETLTGNLWTSASEGDDAWQFLNSGLSTVTIKGGTVGPATGTGIDEDGIPYGSVFGGSRGKAAKDVGARSPRYRYVPDFFLGYVNKAVINIGGTSASALSSNSPTIYGSVYGGGQDGHVRNNTEVRIFKGTIQGQPDEAKRSGHVFGAGSGIGKYDTGTLLNSEPLMACSNSSGSVTCTTLVEVYENATIKGNVYGGGAMASVGPPQTGQGFDEYNTTTNYTTGNRAHGSKSFTQVDIKGGTVEGDVFGASRGPSDTFRKQQFTDKNIPYDETKFATDLWSDVNISGGTISGSVYGGGETGYVKCGVTVDVTGGNITKDVYGGGARANTNISNWKNNAWADATQMSAKYTTVVNLQGGVINGDVYGGGLGRKEATDVTAVDAKVYGDITVKLNENVSTTAKGCILNRIFGCNNLQGSPQGNVTVHVYATQNSNADKNIINDKFATRPVQGENETSKQYLQRLIDATKSGSVYVDPRITASVITAAQTTCGNGTETEIKSAIENVQQELCKLYDVQAVYGGGNLAPYEPVNAFLAEDTEANKALKERARTTVLIDGCGLTSIQKVYGGGNAASVPATYMVVTGTHEIEELFGGGNGKDQYSLDNSTWIDNPGAHVGYKNYSTLSGTSWTENEDANTPEKRKIEPAISKYHYGSGITTTNITGGRIHYVYGGSDTKGNIRTSARSTIEEAGVCEMHIDKAYGGSKDSEMDAGTEQNLDCVKNVTNIYGGSQNATIENDIVVNITNGTIAKVFGGNDTKGMIKGSITINIEEKGCQPIIIGELYGGGYLAPYSIYGYKKEGGNYVVDTSGQYIPLAAGESGASSTPNKNPRINVISATKIGAIYGGGYEAKMIGSPRINVNMQEGQVLSDYVDAGFVGTHTVQDKEGKDVTYEGLRIDETTGNGILSIGTIGNIYGGGNEADVVGDTYVEIGTGEWINENGQREMDGTIKVNNEDLTTTFTYDTNSKKWTYKKSATETVTIEGTPNPARHAATITGNVYGGGKGKADNYICDKAMVGIVDSGEGSTNVIIGNGTVEGNVYGGGEVGRVEKDTEVTIGLLGNTTNEITIEGNVFGAGQGIATHGYSGLVRGNSTVTVQGKAKVRGSVYGGGQKASVGRFYVKDVNDGSFDDKDNPKYAHVPKGMPYARISGGSCTVTVQDDAEIGPKEAMVMTAVGGPDDHGHVFGAGMGITPYVDTDTDSGSGVGQGPGRWYNNDNNQYTWESYANKETDYLEYIETLALADKTDVTIRGRAFIKGSVYGGSENGRVLDDTHVKIQENCQIGNGYVQMDDNGSYLATKRGVNRRYTDAEWEAGHLIVNDDPETTDVDETDPDAGLVSAVGSNYSTSLPECASWPYGATEGTGENAKKVFAPYDKFANADGTYTGSSEPDARGGRPTGSDGHTFYGNVFGGGSGYYPYKAGKWHRAAGAVGGNTVVDILGGHILSSVYGGNEMTDVGTYIKDGNNDNEPIIPVSGGKCTINMTGGTLGVPRTLGQIAAHPVTCYVFGAGKGDTRTFFNTWTNIREAEVNISGTARIYGSTFGGGEDGHVIENAMTSISDGALIGTTGTSYVDGNVFGAGRGYSGDALTAGSVGGNVTVNISGGTMLGSIYGGGRLASVGIGFNAPSNANYGSFTEDGQNRTYGHVTVNISGGTIGNDHETVPNETNIAAAGITETDISKWTVDGEWQTWKNYHQIPNTEYDGKTGLPIHTKGGNVFGGSMGRLEMQDGSYNELWPQLAQVKTATINITGGEIKSNVYGGGELGTVRDNAYVTIGGTRNADGSITASGAPTIFRDVYGGGYGSSIMTDDYKATVTSSDGTNTLVFGYSPMQWAGCVGKGTEVNIKGGQVKKHVYGGGEMASVGVINNVLSSDEFDTKAAVPDDKVIFRKNPKTNRYTVYQNIVKHADETNSFALSWPYKFEYFPSYVGTTKINITGGRLGCTEGDDIGTDNGDVYGGGKGLVGDFNDYIFCANVGSAEITIKYPDSNNATPENFMKDEDKVDCIAGAVYGGAENGHVMGDTKVKLENGLIGHALYGGGSGKSKFSTRLLKIGKTSGSDNNDDYYTSDIYSITAGKVFGNTNVEMSGGYVVRNVFGGGTLGSVGKGNYAGGTDDYSYVFANGKQYNGYGEALNGSLWTSSSEGDNAWHFLNSGKCTVKITGGTVGYVASDPSKSIKDGLPYGNVFGGCRGESAPNITESPRYLYCPEFFVGYANETEVIIGDETKINDENYTGPTILGSVYGGGQDGHVRRDAHVIINKGEIGLAFNSTNRGIFNTTGKTLSQELDDPQWLYRGNVFGAGSGISKYQYDFNYDNKIDDTVEGITYHGNAIKEEDYSTSAGSVTCFTTVDIKGGTIHRNVYGGGSFASVGPPAIPPTRTDLADKKDDTTTHDGKTGWQSQCTVNISGTIGTPTDYQAHYGGEVYGASRGLSSDNTQIATSVWTKVHIKEGADVQGNVFGGGDAGMVKKDSEVIIGEKKTE